MMKYTFKLIITSICAFALLTLCACNNTKGQDTTSSAPDATSSTPSATQKAGNTTSIATERYELPLDDFEEDETPATSSSKAAASSTISKTSSSAASSKSGSSISPIITGSGKNELPIIPLK